MLVPTNVISHVLFLHPFPCVCTSHRRAPQSPVRMKGNQNTSHERKLVDSVKIEKIDKKVRRRSSLKDKDTGGEMTSSYFQ